MQLKGWDADEKFKQEEIQESIQNWWISDQLSGRGGLSVFGRYLKNLALNPHLERLTGAWRVSGIMIKQSPAIEHMKGMTK